MLLSAKVRWVGRSSRTNHYAKFADIGFGSSIYVHFGIEARDFVCGRMDLMTDGDLVRQVLAGTTAAYGPLARRWAPRVLAVCHARAGRSAAEDLAQEALLRGLRSLQTLAEPEKFGPWLLGIATRTSLDWLKSARRRDVSLDAMEENAGNDLAARSEDPAAMDRQERARLLLAEVERLPQPYRETLMLYYSQDCTYEQLAEMLGVSAATINARLTKARAMLRERMLAQREDELQ
jgi:RNA polymerase sigma factor (sigma-70 family)